MANTPHFPLPYLYATQSGKEVTHNEALLLIDLLLHRRAVAVGGDPMNLTAPTDGQAWIVATDAAGDWAGRDGQIALYGAGGWRFITPPNGMILWVESTQCWMRRVGAIWQMPPQAPAIPANANQDDGARSALSAIISTLSSWGLVMPAA
jgi:Protein of unknown function (DUF2793)